MKVGSDQVDVANTLKSLFSMTTELDVARQIKDSKDELDQKIKKESIKQANSLKSLLLKNEKESKQISNLELENTNLLQQILENLQIGDREEQEVDHKIIEIRDLKQDLLKKREKHEELQNKLIHLKKQQQQTAEQLTNLCSLLVKYSRIKFGKGMDNYIQAYYLTRDELTIPIYIEKLDSQKNEKQENEIINELLSRIREINNEYV